MKILFYSHSATKYGATSSMTNLIMGINKLYPTIEVHVILPKKGPLMSFLKEFNIPFSVIPNKPWYFDNLLSSKKKNKNIILGKLWFLKNKWQKSLFNLKYLSKHLEFTKNFSPDFVYVNSSLAPMGGYVASKLKIPLIWHHRETVNDEAYNYYLEFPDRFKEMFKETRLHIYTSQFLHNSYKNFECDNEKLVVFNGVNHQDKIPEVTAPNIFSYLRFGMVGRINLQKGQQEVIDVFHRFKNISDSLNFKHELHIIGRGADFYAQKQDSQNLGINVFFHGFLNREEIYKKFDFLIMNSTNEAFGRVVAEANLYGIPVVARRSGALPEIVKEGINGYLYDDAEDLLAILKSLEKSLNIEEYTKLSNNSLKEFKENYTIEDYTIKIVEKIKTLEE